MQIETITQNRRVAYNVFLDKHPGGQSLSLSPTSAGSPAPSPHTPASNHYPDFHSNDIFYKK